MTISIRKINSVEEEMEIITAEFKKNKLDSSKGEVIADEERMSLISKMERDNFRDKILAEGEAVILHEATKLMNGI